MNFRRIGGLLLISGYLFSLAGTLYAESLYPGYSEKTNFVSDLGVGPAASVFNSVVFISGVLLLFSAIALHRVPRAKLFAVLQALAGIGLAGVGIFPESVPIPHLIVSFLTLAGPLSVIASFKLVEKPLNWVFAFLVALSLAFLAVFLFAVFVAGTDLGLGFGFMERLGGYPIYVWSVLFGASLLKEGKA